MRPSGVCQSLSGADINANGVQLVICVGCRICTNDLEGNKVHWKAFPLTYISQLDESKVSSSCLDNY